MAAVRDDSVTRDHEPPCESVTAMAPPLYVSNSKNATSTSPAVGVKAEVAYAVVSVPELTVPLTVVTIAI